MQPRWREPIHELPIVFFVLIALTVVMRYVSILIHEILGHGLATELLGGSFYAVYANPMGGYSSVFLYQGLGSPLMYMAGLIVTFVLGAALLFIVKESLVSGMARVSLLVLCEALLVPSALYFAFGAIRTDGDTYVTFTMLQFSTYAAVPIGLALGAAFSYFLSREFAQISFPGLDNGFARSMFMWSPGLALTLLGTASSMLLSGGFSPYMLFYALAHVGFALGGSFAASNRRPTWPAAPQIKGALTAVTALAICLALWLGAFGLSGETAHGVMLKAPPVEAESAYMNQSIGNARIHLRANRTAEVEIRLKPVMTDGSPLDRQIFSTFETRPDYPLYEALSINMVRRMLNLTVWYAGNLTTSATLDGDIVGLNATMPNARSCTFQVGANSSGTYNSTSGGWNLTVFDPWKGGAGYLDMLTIEWDPGMNVAAAQPDGLGFQAGNRTMTWASNGPEEAPTYVTLHVEP